MNVRDSKTLQFKDNVRDSTPHLLAYMLRYMPVCTSKELPILESCSKTFSIFQFYIKF